MTNDEIRIAVAIECGFQGCTDSHCDDRKAQHLHKNGKSFFFELFTLSNRRVPNYPLSLDACAEFEKALNPTPIDNEYSEIDQYADWLISMLVPPEFSNYNIAWLCATATPLQRCEAFLRVKGKWKEGA